jgi:hypothetical protein
VTTWVHRLGSEMTDEVLGLTATTTSPIRGGSQPGEIRVAVRGATETYIAFAREPIALHQTVLIVTVRPGRQVDVVPWPAEPTLPEL